MESKELADQRALAVSNLWRYYEEQAAQARQHENLRANVTGTLAGISAAIAALAGVGGFSPADLPAASVVVLLSVLGVSLSLKHYERNRMHSRILAETRREIDSASRPGAPPPRSTSKVRKAAEEEHRNTFSTLRRAKPPTSTQTPTNMASSDKEAGLKRRRPSWIVRAKLHLLWAGLPFGIGLVGVLIIALALVGIED
jgi:hypothetical protein